MAQLKFSIASLLDLPVASGALLVDQRDVHSLTDSTTKTPQAFQSGIVPSGTEPLNSGLAAAFASLKMFPISNVPGLQEARRAALMQSMLWNAPGASSASSPPDLEQQPRIYQQATSSFQQAVSSSTYVTGLYRHVDSSRTMPMHCCIRRATCWDSYINYVACCSS
jgi:hypothetical protein